MCAKLHYFFGSYKHYEKYYTDEGDMGQKKGEAFASPTELRRLDSNERPLGYEPNELPTAPLRDVDSFGGR